MRLYSSKAYTNDDLSLTIEGQEVENVSYDTIVNNIDARTLSIEGMFSVNNNGSVGKALDFYPSFYRKFASKGYNKKDPNGKIYEPQGVDNRWAWFLLQLKSESEILTQSAEYQIINLNSLFSIYTKVGFFRASHQL